MRAVGVAVAVVALLGCSHDVFTVERDSGVAPADASTLLFADDFQADAPGSFPAGWAPIGGTWTVLAHGPAHVVTQTDATATPVEMFAGNSAWTDYKLLVDVKPFDGNSLHITGRRRDTDNHYEFFLKFGNSWTLAKRIHGTYSQLATGAFSYAYGQVHTLGLEMRGSAITASIDGKNVTTVADAEYGSGNISLRGIGANHEYGNVRVLP